MRNRPVWAGVAFRYADGTLEAVEIPGLTDALIDVTVEEPDYGPLVSRQTFERTSRAHIVVRVAGYGHRVERFDDDMGARHQRQESAIESTGSRALPPAPGTQP